MLINLGGDMMMRGEIQMTISRLSAFVVALALAIPVSADYSGRQKVLLQNLQDQSLALRDEEEEEEYEEEEAEEEEYEDEEAEYEDEEEDEEEEEEEEEDREQEDEDELEEEDEPLL